MNETRELYTCVLPDGRTIGFYDFDFTPGWPGNEIDPPESPDVSVQLAYWVTATPETQPGVQAGAHLLLTEGEFFAGSDGGWPVLRELSGQELLMLSCTSAHYAALLERAEEIVEARAHLLRGERERALRAAETAATHAAEDSFARADDCLDGAAAFLRQRRGMWRVRWFKRWLFLRHADSLLDEGTEHVRIGDEYRAKAARLGR